MPHNHLINKLQEIGIIEAIGDAISIQDTDFKILYQNQRHRDIAGDRSGEYCYRAYHGRDSICDNCHLAKCFKDGKSHIVEQSRTTDTGETYADIMGSPLRDAEGNIIAGIEIVRDITHRKHLENQLKDAIAKAEDERTRAFTTLETIGDFVSIQDRNLNIIYQNKISRDTWGDNVGIHCYKAYHGRNKVCDNCHILMCFRDGEIHRTERTATRDNKKMYTAHTASPLKNSSGEIIAGIEVIRDITERKHMEEALQKTHAELEKRVIERTVELQESNTALKVLLKQREKDQKEFENNILSNVKHLILPYIEKLKKNRAMSDELAYLNILESNLQEIVSPFSSKMSFQYLDFTPKEMLVANLIKDGKQDKDIAEILSISLETVKSHRQNIRKKLGIYGIRMNLRTKLLSIIK